jgi:hypothetical protein
MSKNGWVFPVCGKTCAMPGEFAAGGRETPRLGEHDRSSVDSAARIVDADREA